MCDLIALRGGGGVRSADLDRLSIGSDSDLFFFRSTMLISSFLCQSNSLAPLLMMMLLLLLLLIDSLLLLLLSVLWRNMKTAGDLELRQINRCCSSMPLISSFIACSNSSVPLLMPIPLHLLLLLIDPLLVLLLLLIRNLEHENYDESIVVG